MKSSDERHAEDDAEFLGRDREDEVGMRVRDDALDDAFARPLAEPVAANDRLARGVDLERVALAGHELVDTARHVREDV